MDEEVLLRINWEACIYMRLYCVHLDLILSCGAHTEDLGRTIIGCIL